MAGSQNAAATRAPEYVSSPAHLNIAARQHYARLAFDQSPHNSQLQWLPSDFVNHIVTPFDFGRSGTLLEEQNMLIYKGTTVSPQSQEVRGLVDVFTIGSRASCSGLLLIRQIVLTAGHCITNMARPDLVNVHAAWDWPGEPLNALYADALYQFSDGFDLRGPDLALIHLPYPGIYANLFFVNALYKEKLTTGIKFTAFGQGLSAVYDPTNASGPNGTEVWRSGDFVVDSIIQTLLYSDEKYCFKPNAFQQITMPGDRGGPDFTVK